MNDETELPPAEELWEMVKTLGLHVDGLKGILQAEREKNRVLNTENSGWLDVYRRLASETAELKAEILRLELQLQSFQRGPRS